MPLECEHIRNEFSALLDDELNTEDRELVEEHLSECSDCLRELHGYKQVSDAYRYHHPVKAPENFEALFRESVTPTAGGRGSRTWISYGLSAAAVVAVVAGFAVWQLSPVEYGAELARSLPVAEPVSSPIQSFSQAEAPADMAESASAADEAADLAPPDADSGPSAMKMERMEYAPATASPDDVGSDPAARGPAIDGGAEEGFGGGGGGFGGGRGAAPMRATPESASPDSGTADDLESAAARSAMAAEASPEAVGESAPAAPPPAPAEAPPADAVKRKPAADAAALAREKAEAAPATAEERQWRGRTFTLQDGTWREDTYAAQPRIIVAIPSITWNQLLDQFPDLNALVSFREPVIVRLGEKWYEIRRARPLREERPSDDLPTAPNAE